MCVQAANGLANELVYAGFALGVLPTQNLAQTRVGARGALLFYSCVPTSFFGAWPASVPVQVHGMDADPIFGGEGDLDAARELVASSEQAELYLYPGDKHCFADSSLPSYDPDSAALLTQRVLEFLRTRETPQGKFPVVGCPQAWAHGRCATLATRMTAKPPIFDFLRSRGARMSCPFCGHEDWHGWDERVTLDHAIGSGTVDRQGEAFPLTCANCGFIRFQSAHVLDDPRDRSRGTGST